MTKINNQQKIFVKVPFGYGSFRLKVLRSTKWGAIDLLILISLLEKPKSSEIISNESQLPRQLIIEILIPLMKAGWVEIINSNSEFLFALTDRGKAVSSDEELPSSQEPISAVRSFLIDPVTGECYKFEKKKRKQNYLIYKSAKANSLAKQYGGNFTELKIKQPKYAPLLTEILNCLPNENEQIVGIEDEFIKENFSDSLRYMLACVDPDNQISGIPEISPLLKEAIIHAAENQRQSLTQHSLHTLSKNSKSGVYETESIDTNFKARKVDESLIKVITDGSEHQKHLTECIKTANTRLIIHSTFINPSTVEALFPDLLEAARNRTKIDILWGQTEPEQTSRVQQYNELVECIKSFQERINSEGLSTQINFHSVPTGSHSKFIIHDTPDDSWQLTIGSCNWLSTQFNRFEASVQIKDLAIVADALNIASDLATGRYGVSNILSRELAVEAARIYSLSELNKNTVKNPISVQLLTSAEHHQTIKNASDSVTSDFFICSHRFSFAAERPILTPLLAAKRENPNLTVKVAYGRASGAMKNRDANSVNAELRNLGFVITKADDPQIHAKFVTWDQNNLIISSLNWLSASSKGHEFGELGVLITGGDFSKQMMNSFNQFYPSS